MKKHAKYQSEDIRSLTLVALLFAVSLVLSVVESILPPVPLSAPGIKLGLSNIPVMYILFFISKRQALTIAALKSVFVAITRGLVAGFLSFCGGILSVLIMALLLYLFKDRISYLILSISGAVCHNIGQFIAISILYTDLNLWVYLPVLLIFGIIAGIVTSTLLKFILPALKKLGLNKNSNMEEKL